MTKIQLPEWLDLPESSKSVIEGLDIDRYIASVTTGGKLYHKITVNGDLAKQLGVEGQKEVWVEADKVSKLDALQAAIASRTELTGKSLSLSSRRVAEVSSLLQQRWEARPVQAAVSKTVEKTTATRAEMDRKVYELRAAKVDPMTIIRDGTVAGINSIGDYNTAWRRHVRLMQQEQKGYVAPEELNRSASTVSNKLERNPHLKNYMAGITRQLEANQVNYTSKFVPDANGGYYTIQSENGKAIKLSVSQNRLLINEDGRNGYRVINAMAIAKEKDSAGNRLYQSTSYSSVGATVGNAIANGDALKSLNITGSGIDKSSYTWLSSNLAATHSTYGQIKYTEAVPQKGSYRDLPEVGDRANYFYGKTGAVPISAISAIPGTQVFYDKRGRFDYIKADDAAISKIIKRFGLKHQDLVNMGITPTDSIPHSKSRYASPGAAHEPQTGVRLRGGFFTTAVLSEGAGQISSKVAPYISAPFSERRDKFKIDVTKLSDEQKQSILTRLQSPLDGKAATSFLRDHNLGDGSWGNARIEGYDYDGGSHIYLRGALYKQTSDGAALKEAGIKAHLQVGSMPDDLGVDFVTNAPSSPRQFMTNVMGSLNESTLNYYWQWAHKKNAPLLGGMLRYEAARNNPNPDSPEVNISKAEQDAHNKLIDEMIPVWKLFATDNTEFDKHINQPMTEREKEAHEKAGRLVAWSPGEVNQSGERTGMATIKTDFLSVPVDVRLKADIARDRARVSAAEMRVFGELYPETSSRLRRARQGKQKYEIFNQVARYREGIPQRDMMPTFDLKEAMQDSNFRTDIQERAKAILAENPSGRMTEKQARAQALNEYEPAKGHLLKYGEAVFGQSANFAHLGFKMKDGTLKNNVGEVTDDFIDRLFQMHGANKKNIPDMFIPGNEKGKNNSFKWNPDAVADEIAKFQVAQMNNYGVRERMTDTESSMTQSHTFTSIAGMGVQEFGASAAKIAREMQIEPLDENGNVNPLYEVMLKAHDRGLITATAWRSPTPDSKTQLSIVKRAISQAEMDSRQLGVDMGDSMTNVHGKDWVYTQGADNDSDTDKTVIHTNIQKLGREPSKEDQERAAMSQGALTYLKHKNEWYGIENPYKLTDIDTVLKLAAENPADEKVGWEKKAGMGDKSLTPGATGTAFEKLFPGENRITSTEISLGSHEHAGLAGKQIGYTYDLFTKALLPLVRPEFEADAGRMAGRYYQPPLDQKPFERSSAMANMLEFISTYRLEGEKSKGNLATIDQKKGRAKFRREIENAYNLTRPTANPNGTLSFNSKDAFGGQANSTVRDFIRSHTANITEEQIDAIIKSKQKVVNPNDGKVDSGNFRYTFKPDMLSGKDKRGKTIGALTDANEVEKLLSSMIGNYKDDGSITQGIYTGYSDDGKTNYTELHQWLQKLDESDFEKYDNSKTTGMNTVDALLGRDKGRLDKTFRDALFSRTDIANQDQMESVNPIETMLGFMSQIGKGDETVSRELASVMIPGNLAQPQLPLEEMRNRIAKTIQDNKAEGGGLLNLLDSFSEGGRYDQSNSPLGIATKGITYMNMQKDILDETRTLQAAWMKTQKGKVNDMSTEEFYQTHILPNLKSGDGKNPAFLAELPKWHGDDYKKKILSRYTNLSQNAVNYQSSYETLSDSVHAMSLGEQSTHKSWQSLSKFLRNRHLQDKGLVNREVDWKDVNYREMFAESPKPIQSQVNPHYLDEEGVFANPSDDDEAWAQSQFNPNDYGDEPVDHRTILASLVGKLPDKWSTPKVQLTERSELYDVDPNDSLIGKPVPESIIAPSPKPEPLPFTPRPSPKWEEPSTLDRTPKKDNISASLLTSSGSVMLLNLLENRKKTERSLSGHKNIDSEVGLAIKQRAVQLMLAQEGYKTLGTDITNPAKVDFDGGSISGMVDLFTHKDGVAEMIDLTTTSSDDLQQKQYDDGLRTIAKAKILASRLGNDTTIHARTVGMSPEMKNKLRDYKSLLDKGGEANPALIEEFASHLASQVNTRVDGDTKRYDPTVHDPMLAKGYDDALIRKQQAADIYQNEYASLAPGALKEGLFSKLLSRLPKFAKGGLLFDNRSQTSRIGYSGSAANIRATRRPKTASQLGLVDTGKLALANHWDKAEFVINRAADMMMANGKLGNVKGIMGEAGKEHLIDLASLQYTKDGTAIFHKNSAKTYDKPTAVTDGNVAIVPDKNVAWTGEVGSFLPQNLGTDNHTKPDVKMFANGINPTSDSSGKWWFEGKEVIKNQDNDWEYLQSQTATTPQPNQPGLITAKSYTPQTPVPPSNSPVRSNSQPQEGDIRTYASSNQTRVYTNGKWVRGQNTNNSKPTPISQLSPISTQGRGNTPMPMFEKALTPAMLADVRRMGMADQYQSQMMGDYQAMANGQLPNQSPDKEYLATLSAANKYWDKLEGMKFKAETILSKYTMEQGFAQGNNKRGLNDLRRAIRDNGLSYDDAGANAAQYGMSATEAQAYHKVATLHPFSVNANKAALAKAMKAEIDNTQTSLGQSDNTGIAALLGQDELGKDRDISYLGSALHGMFAQNKPALTQRDKRDKLLDERAMRLEVNQAGVSTVRPQSGMDALNATAQGHLQAYQSAHDAFTRGGGWEKPIQEWSDATRASAHEMDRNAISIREINIQSKGFAQSLSSQSETLKAELPSLKADLAEAKKSRSEEKKLRDTFDPASRDYAVHNTKAEMLKDDAKAISATIKAKKDEIANLESTLSGQVKTPQVMGVEAKEGRGGKIGNALKGAFDLQNLFYASSSLANYGYMVGSPLLQARSSHIQEEYNLNRISAMMSPDGKSTRKEMTAINQQQSAFEDAYSEFSKGVYKGLAPIYNAIGKMTSDGNKSGWLETMGQAAPYGAELLTGGIVASKLVTPAVKLGMMGMGMGDAAAATTMGGMMSVPGAIVGGAALAAATLPGLYNTVMRGDSFSVAGFDTGMGANSGIVGKSGDRFEDKVWNNLGQIDYGMRVVKNAVTDPFGNRSNANTAAAIDNMEAGWYSGSMANQNLTPEQAQQARENLNNQQEERGWLRQGSDFVARSTIGFGAMQLDKLKAGLGYSNKTEADRVKEFGEYINGAWYSKQDYTTEAPKPLSNVEQQIDAQYPDWKTDQNQAYSRNEALKANRQNEAAMGGKDNATRTIDRLYEKARRGDNNESVLSKPDIIRVVAEGMDATGLNADASRGDTTNFDKLYDFMVNQKDAGNNLDETLPEIKKALDNAPFAPGSQAGAVFATQVFAKPNKQGGVKTDSQRQAELEYWAKNASSLDQLGQAANPDVIQASMDMYIKDWNSPGGERLARHNQAMRTGLTPGDMMSRTPYYWSNKARDAANDQTIAANADPMMQEATRSLQLVDDKGRDIGFWEKRAAQDFDTRFKNEMELGARYKQTAYIDPLSGKRESRQEIDGFSGGEMQRRLDDMTRSFTQTFGTMADIATKFGAAQTYTADGEGARWKDNRREKYGLDMTGYSDNLVSKMDYQYTMQTKGHDMQMKNYELQLDQIDLNLKKQKESFEMSKDFGEKQKAIQLELFNLETKYKYEDLEIAKGKAAKQYGRQMEDFATQRQRLGVSHGWKMDDFNTQEYRTEVGRSWQLQDNAMNREQFDLQTGWQSEDAERNIRYATGRQRIDLKRNYERQNIMNQLKLDQMYQGEQRQQIQYGWNMSDIDKGRNRENTQNDWANADITKGENRAGEDFATAIADIDRAKARLDETIPLQRQLIELSNEYWKLQMDFQAKYMKEEEAMAKRQKEQITEKMALEQWQFEQQMGWFEIDRKYQEEKAAKDIDIFTRQKAHAEDMARINENLLRIQRELEVGAIAFNTQMHLGFNETSKMYPAMQSMAESAVKMSGGAKQTADNFVTMNNRALTFNMTLEKSVALMAQLGNGTAGDLLPPPVLSGNISTPVAPTIPPHTIGHFNGGYTGNAPITSPAGIVHGQEYVIPHQGSPILREPQVVNLLSSILTALQNTGGTQVVLDGEVISRVVDRTVGGHFANAMGNWDRS